MPGARVAPAQQREREPVLEIDLRRRRAHAPAEARAAMVRELLQVHAPRQRLDEIGLRRPGAPADHVQRLARLRRLQLAQQAVAQRLVAALDQAHRHAFGRDPPGREPGAHAAAPAVHQRVRVLAELRAPARDALRLGGAADQAVAERHRRLLPLALVAGADLLALAGGEDRQVHGTRDRAARELDLGAHVDEVRALAQQLTELFGADDFGAHAWSWVGLTGCDANRAAAALPAPGALRTGGAARRGRGNVHMS